MDHGKIQNALSRFGEIVSNEWEVDFVLLFGSQARGDAMPESDIDVAVVFSGNSLDFDYWTVRTKLSDIAYDILLEIGEIISPLPLWRNQWDDPSLHTNPALVANIHRDGIFLSIAPKQINGAENV